MQLPKTLTVATALLVLAVLITPQTLLAESAIWSDVSSADLSLSGERWIKASQYRLVALDQTGLEAVLSSAPLENSANALVANVVLELPLPDGDFGRFRIAESPVMAPELAAKFPEIRTYLGQGIDVPAATLRFDVTPAGFHAMILSPAGTIYIDPYLRGDTVHHMSYWTGHTLNDSASEFRCGVTGESTARELSAAAPREAAPAKRGGGLPNGDTLKTYRLAVAATGEYTAFHSNPDPPNVADGLAAIVTAMNRVNGIYERDVAIRMTLIANNDQIVYTNAATDPYTNGSGGAMLGQNQSNLDNVIGSANYDIGHVFSTGGGGVASLGVPCVAGVKARGVTGLGAPTGDVFWVDFVAHEMGHQWDGLHTFNGSTGSCANQRSGSAAYEPGSGTTIQAYAGICGSQNIQPNSDDHFHTFSYQEIVTYITAGAGNNCDAPTATGNTPPTVDAGPSYTIPINTPFELCGTATDPNPDVLTYGWEQFNLGPQGPPNNPTGDAPIFRSFSPVLSNCRTFPQLSDLLSNTQTLGEILPSYSRTLTFRLTVRDNRAGGGGVDYDSTDVVVSDVGDSFEVLSPNTSVSWNGLDTETVTWDVAGTTNAPISCSEVDIVFSTDGGVTYTETALLGTPNDGAEDIQVPDMDSDDIRLRVQCSGNIFFDISDEDFSVASVGIIFADSFESGDTSDWTSSVGEL
ncbi:MAG: reprolysin-like metallopeptidase [Acidobacteriota bacterium]